jgi:alpha-mannosidase
VVTSSAPYGHVTRQATCEEEPTQAWVDLAGTLADGTQTGLCLINDGLYGYDAGDNELRLSLLRSPIYAFHDPREVMPGVGYQYIDQGEHHLRLRLIPHLGDWRSVLPDREALAWHEPLVSVQAEAQDGEVTSFSLLEAVSGSAVISVVKLSEGGGLIVRGYECAGEPAEVTLTSDALRQSWSFPVEPHEIWTVALGEDGAVQRFNLLEEPLA